MGTRIFFLIGLLVRLGLIFSIAPEPVSNWYAPFLQQTLFSGDPWSAWINMGGSPAAFPYGYVMWLFFWPLGFLFQAGGLPLSYGYGLTLLIADCSLLAIFYKLLPEKKNKLAFYLYWPSPIVILACYFFGYNDLIPVLLLMTSIFFIKHTKFFWAGFFCISAISAKLSMLLALPFLFVYFINNKPIRQFAPQFLKGITLGGFLFLLPFLFSSAGMRMLFGNPEMVKIYLLALPFHANTKIYVIPLVYFLLLYATWRIKRIHFELLHTILGIMFLFIILMTPASPGWFVWAVPLLSLSLAKNNNPVSSLLLGAFSLLYALGMLFSTRQDIVPLKMLSLFNTAMTALGIILIIHICRESIRKNDYFRFMRKPFVIGIGGDSGSGKDTLANAIEGLFGKHSTTLLSGDNYHLWDRKRPIWRALTHLNPRANNLERLTKDLRSLIDGNSIYSRHYCHEKGKMGRPTKTKSNDIIISSGLHALYLPALRQCCHLKIYLDTSEELRQWFKIQRDVHKRGHTEEKVISSLKKRHGDSQKFIRPQIRHADLIFSLCPVHSPIGTDIKSDELKLRLIVHSRLGHDEQILTRTLIGTYGLRVDALPHSENSEITLTIEGDCSAEDVSLAAKTICPDILEFLDIAPQWSDGMVGVMQLITLTSINKILTERVNS